MNMQKTPTAKIRQFILRKITGHPKDISFTKMINNAIEHSAGRKLSIALKYSFSRTHIPVPLARYGDEDLVSRSQARRLVVRFERFKEIILDFKGITMVGQAFADEIFRVFAREHPHIHLTPVHANADIMKMISRAKNAGN